MNKNHFLSKNCNDWSVKNLQEMCETFHVTFSKDDLKPQLCKRISDYFKMLTMEAQPYEIKLKFLLNISDTKTLQNTCSSSKEFYDICKQNKANILTNLLLKLNKTDNEIYDYYRKNNFIKGVEYFLRNYPESKQACFYQGWKNNNLEMVKLSVKNGAYIHTNNEEALFFSVKNGNLDIFNFLINNGANYKGDNIDNLFLSSIKQKHLEIVEFFVNKGANVHAHGDLAITLAAQSGNIEMIKYLINIGLNINVYDGIVLMRSVESGNLDAMKYLMNNNVYSQERKNSTLIASALANNLEMVKYLVRNKANVTANNNQALLVTTNEKIKGYLLENGARMLTLDEIFRQGHDDRLPFNQAFPPAFDDRAFNRGFDQNFQ
jgi:hypothetical protein